MIFEDDSTVKINGIVLPGVFKSLEIKGSAMIEEQEVKGSAKKPKQATGYDDSKIYIDLILLDGPKEADTALAKLAKLQGLFRAPAQAKPQVLTITNIHTAARGVTQVLFKGLTHKADNKKDQITVSIELWEYAAMTITAAKGGSSSGSGNATSSNLKEEYKAYLPDRGTSPQSPAQDTATAPPVRKFTGMTQ